MNKKLIALLLIITTFHSRVLLADTTTSTSGTFTILKQGDKALFNGILFDPLATAIIITDKEQKENEYKLKLQYTLDKQKTDYDLQIKNLQADNKYQKDNDNEIITSKDKQIKDLTNIAVGKSDNTWLYVGGGFLSGIILTILVTYAVKKTNQ